MTKSAASSSPAKRGRPSKYKEEYPEQARKLCLLGAKDTEIADFFEVSESTLNLWKQEHPEFSESLKEGKKFADAVIAESLFHRAKGYSHPEVHVSNYQGEIILTDLTKHYAPDPTSMIFWLKNRRPDLWRDKPDAGGEETPVLPVKIVVQVEDASQPEAE